MDNPMTKDVFGLMGDFPGDDKKFEAVTDLMSRLGSAEKSSQISTAEVVQVLDHLPMKGRIYLTLRGIGQSPARDGIVKKISDWCFESDDTNTEIETPMDEDGDDSGLDDDFVVVSPTTRDLNPLRNHILRIFTMTAGGLGEAGVTLCRDYLASSSTMFRSQVLIGMTKNPGVTDDELETVYLESVVAHQEAIVTASQQTKHRCDFLHRLYKKELVSFDVLFHNPDSSVIRPVLEKNKHANLSKWNLHSALYLEMLETSFQKFKHDPLGRGAALRAWENRCHFDTDLPHHALKVLDLCDTYRPMEVTTTTDSYVTSILVKASAAGELGEAPNDLEQLRHAFPLCHRMLKPKEYKEWILNQVKPCSDKLGVGFVDPTKETFLSQALSSGQLFSQNADYIPKYLNGVSEELFWKAIREDGTKTKASCSVRFFRVIALICKGLASGRAVNSAREATFAWCDLHMRCRPNKVVPDMKNQEDVISDWNIWRKSYMDVVSNLAANAAQRHGVAIARSAPEGLSGATLWVGFSRIILDLEIDGYMSMLEAGFVTKHDHVISILDSIGRVERKSSEHTDYNVCVALAERVVSIFKSNVLPLLETLDAAKENDRTFVMQRLLAVIIRLCQTNYKDRPELIVSVSRLIRKLSQQALPPEALLKDPCLDKTHLDADGRTVRSFYRANVAEQQSSAGTLVTNLLVLVELFCSQCHSVRFANENASNNCIVSAMSVEDMQSEIKSMWGWFSNPNGIVVDQLNLIQRVAAAWPGIVDQEASSLVALGKRLVRTGEYKWYHTTFMELGISEQILADCDEKTRHTFLVTKNTNTAAPGVREYLEQQATGRDATVRMDGYKRLLELSLKTSLEEFAKSITYIAKRTKNEAGIYRSTLLHFLVQSAYEITKKSFEEAQASAENEKATIDLASTICQAFIKMLQDDVSKRDSVGKGPFLLVSKEILRYCVGPTSTRLPHSGLDLHFIWVTLALRLQWIRDEVLGGEAKLQDFTWQLPTINMSDNWVKFDDLNSLVRPLLQDEILIRRIRATIHFGSHAVNKKLLSPDERVTLLRNGLLTIKKEHKEQNTDSAVSTETDSLSELQLNTLFSFAKERWVQVHTMVKAMVEATSAPEKDFERTYRLFKLACSHLRENLWCHMPLLASACESILHTAIKLGHEQAKHILDNYWKPMMRTKAANVDFSKIGADPAAISFLSIVNSEIHASIRKRAGCLPDDFDCSIASALLGMTKSSWFLRDVKKAVEKSRDDILADLLESDGNVMDLSSGVFYPDKKTENSSLPAFDVISAGVQTQLRSRALRLYIDHCIVQARSKRFNISTRCSRITEFVEAPCTGYRDIWELLQELEEGPLLESLLLCIFRIDSAWKVLAYLLRPSVIAKRSPRATAGLLDRVAKEMHSRKVELVLSVLLKEGPRQKALSPYLMKCILRSLFDIGSETSAGLIRSQWNRGEDLHKDVQHDLVRLSVLALIPKLGGSESSGKDFVIQIAWEIVESSCAKPNLEIDSAALILAPRWTYSRDPNSSLVKALDSPTGLRAFSLPQQTDSEKQEAFNKANSELVKARQTSAGGLRLDFDKLLDGPTSEAVERYGRVLCALSDNHSSLPVRLFARCHSNAFSSKCLLAADDREDSAVASHLKKLQASLEALLERTKNGDLDIYDNYELVYLAGLMAIFAMNAVERKYWNLPAEVRTKNAAEAEKDVIDKSHCAKLLVSFLGDCVEYQMSTPLCQTSRIMSLAAVNLVVSDSVDRFRLPQNPSRFLFKSLNDKIRVLKLAGSALNAMKVSY